MTGYQIRNYATILIALIVLVLFIKSPLRRGGGNDDHALYPKLKAEEMDRIRVINREETVDLVRRAPGDWIIDGTFPLPADTSFIRRAVESVVQFSTVNLQGRNPEKHAIFEVDSTGAQVEVFAGSDAPVASFILGKNSKLGGTFYRLTDQDDVYLTDAPVKNFFVKPKKSWRNRRIFNTEPTDFTSLTVEHGDSTIVFETDAELNWHLKQPEEFPVKKEEVDGMLRRVCRLYSHSMPDSIVAPEETGLDTPILRVRAERLDGSGLELLVGKQNDGGYFYCKAADRDWLYLVAKYVVDPFYKDPLEMKAEPPPPPAEPPAPTESLAPTELPAPTSPPAEGTSSGS